MKPVPRSLVEKPYPEPLVKFTRQLLTDILAMFPPTTLHLADLLMLRYADHARQAEEAAADLDLSPREVFLANLSYDLAMSFGCSTMALATEQGPLLARNMDWFHEASIARASCIVATDAGWSA